MAARIISQGTFLARQIIRTPFISNIRMMSGKPVVASKEPYCETLVSGKRYSWCTCGLSHKQPFCDGSHRGSGLRPHRMKAAESAEVYLCGCKQTKTAPFCDGTHMGDHIQTCKVGEAVDV